jgi:hypothetical protein
MGRVHLLVEPLATTRGAALLPSLVLERVRRGVNLGLWGQRMRAVLPQGTALASVEADARWAAGVAGVTAAVALSSGVDKEKQRSARSEKKRLLNPFLLSPFRASVFSREKKQRAEGKSGREICFSFFLSSKLTK